MRSLSKFCFIAFSVISLANVNAHCPRCEQIEAQREKEQAAHPQQPQYYDEAHKEEITPVTPTDAIQPLPVNPEVKK